MKIVEENLLKSPINYTGNKYRILNQILPYFPSQCDTMVDLFCGGATVGINTTYKNIVFIDSDKHVISLLKYLSKVSFDEFVQKVDKLTSLYGLTCSYVRPINKKNECGYNNNNGLKNLNEKGYYNLRNDYNLLENKYSNKANLMLYVLMAYGFNNDLRFSKDGKFNIPVGKTDFNKNNANKVKDFINSLKTKNVKFICASFTDNVVADYVRKSDFIYMDPPYLITDAVYNETPTWSYVNEHQLLDFIDQLILSNKNFILSNCISRNEKINEPLSYWFYKKKDLEMINIDYNYHTCSYNKKLRDSIDKEIIILPKGKRNVRNKK